MCTNWFIIFSRIRPSVESLGMSSSISTSHQPSMWIGVVPGLWVFLFLILDVRTLRRLQTFFSGKASTALQPRITNFFPYLVQNYLVVISRLTSFRDWRFVRTNQCYLFVTIFVMIWVFWSWPIILLRPPSSIFFSKKLMLSCIDQISCLEFSYKAFPDEEPDGDVSQSLEQALLLMVDESGDLCI